MKTLYDDILSVLLHVDAGRYEGNIRTPTETCYKWGGGGGGAVCFLFLFFISFIFSFLYNDIPIKSGRHFLFCSICIEPLDIIFLLCGLHSTVMRYKGSFFIDSF